MKIFLSTALLIGAILAAKAGQALITSAPQNLTINAGSTADFLVRATNAETYQWTFQGANIAGATNAELNFSDVSTNQAGLYSVILGTGSTGTNLTNSATLTVLQGTIVQFRISGFASGPSNVLVELFDHDKPATVQNFIHYITSGAYTNMFFDRLLPGFVLQGGTWLAQNRTNSTNVLIVDPVSDIIVAPPPLPQQIDSEFYLGPKVSNTKGTIAMALPSGNVNGASSAFFFNLVDNPFLDVFTNGGGPFTVFGRVLSDPGTNVLAYFNNTNFFFKPRFTSHPTTDIFTHGIFDFVLLNPSDTTTFTDLPVNYHAAHDPANRNLFFVDFTFPDANAQPVIYTNPPAFALTFPPANVVFTNGTPVTLQGTAQDQAGLAFVECSLIPQNGAYGGLPGGGTATGTYNWSADFGLLEPGIYNILVAPVDGAGNIGNPSFVEPRMTISAVFTSGSGTVTATNLPKHTALGDAVGANFVFGTNYAFAAHPAPGWFFDFWKIGANVSFNQSLTNRMTTNLVLTANFVTNSVTNGIAFSYPPLGGNTPNGTFSIQGAVGRPLTPPVIVTCRLYSYTNQQLVGTVRQVTVTNITVTNNWSFPVTNLALGRSYYALVMAQDALGQGTVISNYFTPGLLMTVRTIGNGRGKVETNYDGHFLAQGQVYSMTAAASAGSRFDNWSDNTQFISSPAYNFRMTPGLTVTATFISNDLPAADVFAFAYPTNGARLTIPTFNLTGTISPAITNPVISYQLFAASQTVTPPGTAVAIIPGSNQNTSTWSVGLTNLPPGSYTVVATVFDVTGRSRLISENFQILAHLHLQSSPPGLGSVSSNWSGQFVPIGALVTATAHAKGDNIFAYWSNSFGTFPNNPLAFIVATNETITACFVSNYFRSVAGTYKGLFYPTNTGSVISPTNSGYYSFSVTASGAINLSLSFPATNLTSTGQFTPLYNLSNPRYATAKFGWTGLDGHRVTNVVNLDVSGQTNALIGSVTNAKFSSYLEAHRVAAALTSNSIVLPGRYVLSIPGDHAATNNHPGGDGYGTFTIGTNGAVVLAGLLADNTAITPTTSIVTNTTTNGSTALWPFYASLYGGKGIILGWQTNTSTANFEGVLRWSKPARTGAYYTNAFRSTNNSFAAAYLPPVAQTQYQLVVGGASLTTPLTNTLTVATNGLFTVDSGPVNIGLALTNNLASGALTGSFSYPSRLSTHLLHGAFASPDQGGAGYFRDTNSQTGWFQITAIVAP
jgi:cyclophilin family peptidyl-prolyl cis-trans isomerase